ncbi:MAG TPA: PVC-type heme-binding CxxCH protein, partial [Pirellulales bacterium]|nr:PVC-type heme-binding CxxCH protein [Pirellulales bacterium]
MRFRSLCALLLSVLSAWTTANSYAVESSSTPAAILKVPEGYEVELVAGPPLVEHPTMGGFDAQGRLYICDGPGENMRAADLLAKLPNLIRRLEDTDGDGRFDKATVFADKMTFPMGALWYGGSIYTASPPHIWKLTDSDGDGVADQRQILVSEFGFTGNAADIHGCFLGPDGWLYWCDGRHGHNFVDDQGNQISKGLAARLFRCRLDGSQVESFAGGGMDNPVEVCFTEQGEPLGTVAIFDVVDGRHDALIHWVYGGAYPRYEQKCLEEFRRTGPLMPQVSRLLGVAPSGIVRYRNNAMGLEPGEHLFHAQFNTHTVVKSRIERVGATFRSHDDAFLTSDDPDFHPTDVIE